MRFIRLTKSRLGARLGALHRICADRGLRLLCPLNTRRYGQASSGHCVALDAPTTERRRLG
jgi:hypothetical protein